MYKTFKKILDIINALFLLVVFFVPILVIAICIKIEDKGPVFFKQKRIGKNLKPFYIYKFRTMKFNLLELNGKEICKNEVTNIGRFLRKTGIDEIPQLLNIIKGEMSFIGPRPWIEDYYLFLTDEQKKRSNVLPGISGLAQVKGGNDITIFQKINYDLEYVQNYNFILDLKIVFLTLKIILKKENTEITEEGIKKELENLKNQK